MKVSKAQFKEDLKKRFEGRVAVSIWENDPVVDKDGDEVVHVGLSKGDLTLKEAQELPAEVDGVKIVYYYIGEITLMKTTDKYDPLIGGISIGAIDVTAGTLGGVVWDKKTHEPYLITNEHVVSNTQNTDPLHPPKGFAIVQPGPIDGGTELAGKLFVVGGMKERAMDGAPCNIDAALIMPVRGFAAEEFWGVGQVEAFKHAPAKVGDEIVKSGRTTGVTENAVAAVDVSTNLRGIKWSDPLLMEGLIQTRSSFVQGGDSGSRVWKKSTMEPIGLVFAGSWLVSLIIPAQTICDVLGVYFGWNEADPPEEETKKKCLFSRIWGFVKRFIKMILGGDMIC